MSSEEESTAGGDILLTDQGERFKLAQAIYGAVTAKTEKLSHSHNANVLITRSDLDQLDAKCDQACSQWRVLNNSTSVTVHHTDDNKEQFSSYRRFGIYDTSRTSPVESIVYERDMLLALPGVKKPQPYKLTVRILSRVALYKRMERDMASPPSFFRFFQGGAVVIEIEYVDYVVARTLLSTLDSWVAEVEKIEAWSWATRLHDHTHWIPRAATVALVAVALMTTVAITPNALSENSGHSDLATWILIAGTGLWLVGVVARTIGRWVEHSIDSIIAISAVKLNKGDERLLTEYHKRNRWRFIRAAGGVVLITAQGIAVEVVGPQLANWLLLGG
jgi:hypothetical protein